MINVLDPDIWTAESIPHDLLITDGTVTVSGETYSVSGATVTIENNLLESEGFELKQSLCSTNQLKFGSCESGSVTFVVHENIPTVKGKTLKVYMIPDHKASKKLKLGTFKAYEDNLSADRTKRTIVAYDAMYEIINSDVSAWYNTVLPTSTSSMTLAQFRASFFNHFGIEVEPITLVNDNATIKRTIEPETLSGADVIKAICEINGCFGTITNEGKFRFVELSPDLDMGLFPSDTLYPSNTLYPQDINANISEIPRSYYIDVQFEDYNAESITGLTIRTDDEDVGVTVGTNTNVYVISGNFLVFGYNATALTTIATNALAKMTNRYYTPCTINALGNPLREVGDGIRVNTTYRGIVTYALERRLSGIQALRDTYSAQGEQKFAENLNSIASQFKQLEGKTLKIKADVDGIETEVSDLDTREASHYSQTSGAITAEVTRATGAEGGLSTRITANADGLSAEVTRATGVEGTLSSSITANATAIALKVSYGEVSSQLTLESGQVTLSSNRLVVNSTNFTLAANGDATFSGTINGAILTSSGSYGYTTIWNGLIEVAPSSSSTNQYIHIQSPTGGAPTVNVADGGKYSVTGAGSLIIQGNNGLYDGIQVRDGDIKIDGYSVITTNTIPSNILTTSSSIATSQIAFGKTFTATGTSGTYTMKLQTITINGNQYVMYADASP